MQLRLSLPVWPLSTALKGTGFCFVLFCFVYFCTNGTLATSPVAADLCPGWGMKGFPVLCESNSALPRGKQRSALGHGETYSFSIGTWLLLQF